MLRYFFFTVNYNITFRKHTFTLYLANGILGFIQGISAYKNEMLTCSSFSQEQGMKVKEEEKRGEKWHRDLWLNSCDIYSWS